MITRRLATVGIVLALGGLALSSSPARADQGLLFWDHGWAAGFKGTWLAPKTLYQEYHLEGLTVFPLLGRIPLLEGTWVESPRTAVAYQTIVWAPNSPAPGESGAYGTVSGRVTYTTMDGSKRPAGSTLVADFTGVFVNVEGKATFTAEVDFSGTGRLAGVTGTGYMIIKNVVFGQPPFEYELIGKLSMQDQPQE